MLEQIAKQVNLKKRVVQVWYQNSRARERKGQYRATGTSLVGAGNLMPMDNFGGIGGSVVLDEGLKSPKMGDIVPPSASTADLGFLFNSFKQNY